MRKLVLLLNVVVLFVCPILAEAFQEGYARISFIEGEALIKTEDSTDWLPAAMNTPLYEGDSIWSPSGSRIELHLQNDTRLRLDGNTSVDMEVLDRDLQQFYLGMGRAYVKAGDLKQSRLQLEVNGSSVKVHENATLRVDIAEDGNEEIALLRGSAQVEGNTGRTRLRTGEMLIVDGDRGRLEPLRPWDEWEQWNRDRDRALEGRRGESRYLPDELASYSSELEANGEWVADRQYGYVWRPTVAVTVADWSPYLVGRWIWRGGDYVWISHESWGWAPYHYGRWITRPGWGWCWVPPARSDVFWSPGYVGWITTPTYVGWVPLAPGETYYGRRHYGRHSAIATTVTVNTRVSYRNMRSNNITVVAKESFAAGRGEPGRVRENVLSRRSATFGPPAVAPTAREARMPILREVQKTKLPPAALGRKSHERRQIDRAQMPAAVREPVRTQDQILGSPAPALSSGAFRRDAPGLKPAGAGRSGHRMSMPVAQERKDVQGGPERKQPPATERAVEQPTPVRAPEVPRTPVATVPAGGSQALEREPSERKPQVTRPRQRPATREPKQAVQQAQPKTGGDSQVGTSGGAEKDRRQDNEGRGRGSR